MTTISRRPEPAVAALWREARLARNWTQEEAAMALGLALPTVRAIEQGRRRPGPRASAAARTLGVPDGTQHDAPGGQGGGDQGLSVAEYETLLGSQWALFYAGQGAAADRAVQVCLRALGTLRGDAAMTTMGRFHQLAGVLARDHRSMGDAIAHGAAAVEIARQLGRPDNLASALFRLARTYQQSDNHAASLATISEAHELAPRCRQPLAGWLKLSRVEVESKAVVDPAQRLPLTELRRLTERAMADLANRPGVDESYTALTAPGIWHIEVLALLREPGHAGEAAQLIQTALDQLRPDQHRWRHGMLATEVLCYATLGDAQAAADLAEDVVPLTSATSHRKYLRAALERLAADDPRQRNPHVERLRRLLTA